MLPADELIVKSPDQILPTHIIVLKRDSTPPSEPSADETFVLNPNVVKQRKQWGALANVYAHTVEKEEQLETPEEMREKIKELTNMNVSCFLSLAMMIGFFSFHLFCFIFVAYNFICFCLLVSLLVCWSILID